VCQSCHFSDGVSTRQAGRSVRVTLRRKMRALRTVEIVVVSHLISNGRDYRRATIATFGKQARAEMRAACTVNSYAQPLNVKHVGVSVRLFL
jgi:hypothetical protein